MPSSARLPLAVTSYVPGGTLKMVLPSVSVVCVKILFVEMLRSCTSSPSMLSLPSSVTSTPDMVMLPCGLLKMSSLQDAIKGKRAMKYRICFLIFFVF